MILVLSAYCTTTHPNTCRYNTLNIQTHTRQAPKKKAPIMTTRKHNEFLDIEDDSDTLSGQDGGYDSDAAEGRLRGALISGAKRRRVETKRIPEVGNVVDLPDPSEDEDEDEDVEDSFHTANGTAVVEAQNRALTSRGGEEEEHEEDEQDAIFPIEQEDDAEPHDQDDQQDQDQTQDPIRARSLRKAAQAAARTHKSGVLYISRVPPFMKPTTLTQLLLPHASHGGLGRVFLTPETSEAHARRVRGGGNKKKSFTDGWVEFASKRDARWAAERLNGNLIGGKKGGFYHDDLWNVRYLRGFKWGHLTEQIAHENASRAARVREEVRRTRKENRTFVEDVQRGKMEEGMEGRRREGAFGARRKMEFKQTTMVRGREGEAAKPSADVRRVLGKIF